MNTDSTSTSGEIVKLKTMQVAKLIGHKCKVDQLKTKISRSVDDVA